MFNKTVKVKYSTAMAVVGTVTKAVCDSHKVGDD